MKLSKEAQTSLINLLAITGQQTENIYRFIQRTQQAAAQNRYSLMFSPAQLGFITQIVSQARQQFSVEKPLSEDERKIFDEIEQVCSIPTPITEGEKSDDQV
jgi:hypothetical protein